MDDTDSQARKPIPPKIIFEDDPVERETDENSSDGGSREASSDEESVVDHGPRTVKFRLGTRNVVATGAPTDWAHPNVLRLVVHRTIFQSLMEALHRWLPPLIRSWISASFPEWFLPAKIILKRQKKGWTEEFETETATYEKLRPLQGLVIPVYYGQVDFQGVRAIVLSDVGGSSIADPEGATLKAAEIQPLFHQAISAVASLGIFQEDPKLDNFMLVDRGGQKAVMLVDFERVDTELPKEDRAEYVGYDVAHLMRRYRNHLQCLKSDGLLLNHKALE